MTSVGQKVSGGSSAPTKTEATGSIPSDSLAAESIRSGGAFSANKCAAPGDKPAQDSRAGAPRSAGQPRSGSGSLEGQSSYGGPAPTYVTSQFRVDDKGPHGKNLKEGGFEGSGTDGSNLPDPGSKQDPARGAEQSFVEGRGVRRGKLENEQPYEALKSDESV